MKMYELLFLNPFIVIIIIKRQSFKKWVFKMLICLSFTVYVF